MGRFRLRVRRTQGCYLVTVIAVGYNSSSVTFAPGPSREIELGRMQLGSVPFEGNDLWVVGCLRPGAPTESGSY